MVKYIPGENMYTGLSTDIKPAGDYVPEGVIFYEVDTKKGWLYDVANINPATGNYWWEV